jgi:hypothetical protein
MLQIDIDADLNWVDDQDRNIAKVADAAARYKPGDVAVADRPQRRQPPARRPRGVDQLVHD